MFDRPCLCRRSILLLLYPSQALDPSFLLEDEYADAQSDCGQASDDGASDRALRGARAGFWRWRRACEDGGQRLCCRGGRWGGAGGRADGDEVRGGGLLALRRCECLLVVVDDEICGAEERQAKERHVV